MNTFTFCGILVHLGVVSSPFWRLKPRFSHADGGGF